MSARRNRAWVPLALAAAFLLSVLYWMGPPPRQGAPQEPGAPEARPQPEEGRREEPAPAPRSRRPGPSAPAEGGAARPEREGERGLEPRLAVVIDDVGYEMGPVRELLKIDAPLSLAVIPHQRHSRRAAELIHRRGREVLVHLPMEPIEYPRKNPGEGALLSSMDAEELRLTLRAALAGVPHARGLNNHMGSRLTASPRAMQLLMEELGDRRLYFLDSRTAGDSVALGAARAASVPCLERDVFLDARRERDFVEEQLRLAAEQARRRGRAVAIGHPHPVTLEVLRRELPRLQAEGVRLVFASQLAS